MAVTLYSFTSLTRYSDFNDRIISKIDFSKDGNYTVNVSGDLTMHGVTKKVSAPGTLQVKGGKVTADSKFPIRLADYNISIPKLVKDNIAEVIDVTVSCGYDQKM